MRKFYLAFLLMISTTMVILPSVKAVSESNEKHQQLTVSEQGYSLSLPGEYTLQKEEDGKDILFQPRLPIRGCELKSFPGKKVQANHI